MIGSIDLDYLTNYVNKFYVGLTLTPPGYTILSTNLFSH
jgi:hypothetical protein